MKINFLYKKIIQLKIIKPSLILENSYKICFSSENYETSSRFFSKIMLYVFFETKSCSMLYIA